MNTNIPKKFAIYSIIGFMFMMLVGCYEEEEPKNSNVHFTNSTDKDVKIIYYRLTNIPFEDQNREDWISVGEQKTLSIMGSHKTIEFTIVYNNVEYDRSISINSLGDDAEYDITLESLGIPQMANG